MERLVQIGRGKLSGTAAAVGTLDVTAFNELALDITTLSAETISVYPSFDGGTTFSTIKLAFAVIITPATCTVVDLTNTCYQATYFPACTHVKFVKSAAVGPVLIHWTLRAS